MGLLVLWCVVCGLWLWGAAGCVWGVSWGGGVDLLVLVDQSMGVFGATLGIIVGVVWIFGIEYMGGYNSGFFILLGLFVGSMVLLLFSSNVFFVLVGWDWLGLSSFLLVVFYASARAWSCGVKTFLVNRLGDGFLMGVVGVCVVGGDGEMWSIFTTPLALVLLLGLMTKSAQYPFMSWLPAAMAAPTPVSALVHSSTLVTAGVYVLFRLSTDSWEVGVLGLWTVFLASLWGFFESDGKKIVAYSTLSQVGFMSVALGSGLSGLCLLHLICHAFFKANMFICIGYGLLNNQHSQDVRLFENFGLISFCSFCVSVLSLNGLVFLSGLYSKDALVDQEGGLVSWGCSGLFLCGVVGTVFYSGRLLSYCGCGVVVGWGGFTPLWLGVGSVLCGWVLGGQFWGMGWVVAKFLILLIIGLGVLGVILNPSSTLGWGGLEYLPGEGGGVFVGISGWVGWVLDSGLLVVSSRLWGLGGSGVLSLGGLLVGVGVLMVGLVW